MGFLDSVQDSINRAAASTGRATTTMQLKGQIKDVLKRRQQLAAQLGASLYEVTRDNPELRAGREPLFDGIAACDAERAQCEAQIAQLEAEGAAAAAAAQVYTCPRCQARVSATDMFCSGCGLPIAEVKAAYAQQQAYYAPQAPAGVQGAGGAGAPAAATCPQCGAPVTPGDAFCMSCGCKLGGAAPAGAAPAAGAPGEADAADGSAQ